VRQHHCMPLLTCEGIVGSKGR